MQHRIHYIHEAYGIVGLAVGHDRTLIQLMQDDDVDPIAQRTWVSYKRLAAYQPAAETLAQRAESGQRVDVVDPVLVPALAARALAYFAEAILSISRGECGRTDAHKAIAAASLALAAR